MENDGTVCYTVTLIKSFSFVPISFGYVIYKHHTVGIVLKVNPQSHCCYQNQSIKHNHRKILSKIFLVFRKKRKHAKAFTSKNGHITKSLATVFYYDNICNTIIKSPGQIRSKPGVTVPRCTSHCLASIKQMFSNMLPNINVTKRHNSVSIQQVRSYVHSIKTENQKDWLKRVR